MIDMKKYKEKAEKLKAIAHHHRLCIIKGLLDRECNVSKMQECLELPQSTISQHLSKLRATGIIEGERNGIEINYKVIDEEIKSIVQRLFEEQN